jgi:hypothetical protein
MKLEVGNNLFPGALQKSNRSLVVDKSSFSTAQWKYDDLKVHNFRDEMFICRLILVWPQACAFLAFFFFQSWIWLQKAIHPELDYDLCLKKKWVSDIVNGWKPLSTSVHLWSYRNLHDFLQRMMYNLKLHGDFFFTNRNGAQSCGRSFEKKICAEMFHMFSSQSLWSILSSWNLVMY